LSLFGDPSKIQSFELKQNSLEGFVLFHVVLSLENLLFFLALSQFDSLIDLQQFEFSAGYVFAYFLHVFLDDGLIFFGSLKLLTVLH